MASVWLFNMINQCKATWRNSWTNSDINGIKSLIYRSIGDHSNSVCVDAYLCHVVFPEAFVCSWIDLFSPSESSDSWTIHLQSGTFLFWHHRDVDKVYLYFHNRLTFVQSAASLPWIIEGRCIDACLENSSPATYGSHITLRHVRSSIQIDTTVSWLIHHVSLFVTSMIY